MIRYLRSHLAIKLFLSYILVILVGVIVIVFTTRFTVPEAFNRHMGMGQVTGQGMMAGQGQGRGIMSDLFLNFQASFNEALLLALLVAGFVAILISLIMSRGVVASVHVMTKASQRIAEGHYGERVQKTGEDELGQLAHSFNQMAEKLEQVENMRRQLIGDVSHELRTPLTAIKGSMEGLMDGVLPASEETYQQIHQEAGRLARLVDDLQELSRVEAGAYPLEKKPIEMSSLVQIVIKRLKNQAAGKSIDLKTDIPENLPPVMADQDRITQVLTNLVNNAIQYTPEGGWVTISASHTADKVQVSVADSGIGIPKEHLQHLFTRFYRVDKSRSRQSGGGSGIGLTISRHLIEAHGGKIWVESSGDGQGSTISFNLNIAR
jgi:signal transduction histidine kinase